jgi:hypothetical protein
MLDDNVLVKFLRWFSPPKPHLGVGLAILSVMFMAGWTKGLRRSNDMCVSAGDDGGCDPLSIGTTLARALFEVFGVAFLIMLLMVVVETLVVETIGTPLTPSYSGATPKLASEMLTVRVMIAWMLDPRMRAAIIASVVASAIFAFTYIAWLKLRGGDVAVLKQAVRDIYAFQLAAFFMFVAAQLALTEPRV